MYFLENEYTEDEVLSLIQESVHDPENDKLREMIIDPIIKVLEKPSSRKQYIEYGNSFLEVNSEMLAREYPTKRVTFPRKYVDNVFELFGFTVASFKPILKDLLKQVHAETEFATITSNPSNVIHSIVIFYADMVGNRELRDSARQQLCLSVYSAVFNHFFPSANPNEHVMAYTYLNLNRSWDIVKAGNLINWIGATFETAYAFFRTRLLTNMSMEVLVKFLNRVRTSFQQNLRGIVNRYWIDLDEQNMVGGDLTGDEDHVTTSGYTTLRINIVRFIKNGDSLYKSKDKLYPTIAKWKNVKNETLYNFAQTIDHKDIGNIIDTIFYVFLVKEGNKVEDINSSKYIARIKNLPTAIDRAIQGKPIVIPLSKKYKTDESIIRAYICLIATYIMYKINDANKK